MTSIVLDHPLILKGNAELTMKRLPLSFSPILCGGRDGFAWGPTETWCQSGSWNLGKRKCEGLDPVCPHVAEPGLRQGPGPEEGEDKEEEDQRKEVQGVVLWEEEEASAVPS